MRTLSFLIHDRRYSVPTLRLLSVPNEARAHELAAGELQLCADHLSVEVHDEDRLLFRKDRADLPFAA